jgi:dGTPase
VERLYPDAPKKLQFNEVLRRILDRWVSDLIWNTEKQIASVAVQCGAGVPPTLTLDDIRNCPRRLAGLSPEAEAERRQTKDFLYQNLYFSPALEPEKADAERVITELFALWMKHPQKLPPSYQEKAESEPLARIVCDYIAGMTDTYINEQYQKYCG